MSKKKKAGKANSHYAGAHKLLRELLGDDFPEYAIGGKDDRKSKREKKYIRKYGCPRREYWDFDTTLAAYVYEHLVNYEDNTNTDLDETPCTYYTRGFYEKPEGEEQKNPEEYTKETSLREGLHVVESACLRYLKNHYSIEKENEITKDYI